MSATRADERAGGTGASGRGGPGDRDGRDGPEVVLRPMTASDLDGVLAIERASFGVPWTPATFLGLLEREDTRLWVAEAAAEPGRGRILGYAVVWTVLDQAELGDLAVEPGVRRSGVGRRLLEAVLEHVDGLGVRELYLEVRVSNTGAQALYHRYGFLPVGRRPGYYTKPREDALVLRRSAGG